MISYVGRRKRQSGQVLPLRQRFSHAYPRRAWPSTAPTTSSSATRQKRALTFGSHCSGQHMTIYGNPFTRAPSYADLPRGCPHRTSREQRCSHHLLDRPRETSTPTSFSTMFDRCGARPATRPPVSPNKCDGHSPPIGLPGSPVPVSCVARAPTPACRGHPHAHQRMFTSILGFHSLSITVGGSAQETPSVVILRRSLRGCADLYQPQVGCNNAPPPVASTRPCLSSER